MGSKIFNKKQEDKIQSWENSTVTTTKSAEPIKKHNTFE